MNTSSRMNSPLGDEVLGGLFGESALHEAAHAALEGLGEMEWEDEDEGAGEDEWEDELNPVRKIYPDAALEHLVHTAINAESEVGGRTCDPARRPDRRQAGCPRGRSCDATRRAGAAACARLPFRAWRRN